MEQEAGGNNTHDNNAGDTNKESTGVEENKRRLKDLLDQGVIGEIEYKLRARDLLSDDEKKGEENSRYHSLNNNNEAAEDYTKRWWGEDSSIKVQITPEKGRHLIATKDLKAGDRVLLSHPYTYFTYELVKQQVCLWCFHETTDTLRPLPFHCDDCRECWYCSEECCFKDWTNYHQYECPAIRVWNANVNWTDPSNVTEIRLFFRTLARRVSEMKGAMKDEKVRFKDFFSLITNRDKWQNHLVSCLESITSYTKTIAPELLLEGDGFNPLSEKFLLEILLKTRNNMFNIYRSMSISLGWGVYVEASFFNHNCQANVCIFRTHKSTAFDFVAIHDIPAGTELTISYLGFEGDLKARREHLGEQYFFKCQCSRCSEEEQYGFSPTWDDFSSKYRCKQDVSCIGNVVPRLDAATGQTKLECSYCCLETYLPS